MKPMMLIAAALGLALGTAAAAEAQTATLKPASTSIAASAKPTPKLSLYTRAQTRLKTMGEYSGAVNGKRDEATIAAIKRFQTSQKLPVSGRLTPETLKALGV